MRAVVGTLFINKPSAEQTVSGCAFISAGELVILLMVPSMLLKVTIPACLLSGLYSSYDTFNLFTCNFRIFILDGICISNWCGKLSVLPFGLEGNSRFK